MKGVEKDMETGGVGRRGEMREREERGEEQKRERRTEEEEEWQEERKKLEVKGRRSRERKGSTITPMCVFIPRIVSGCLLAFVSMPRTEKDEEEKQADEHTIREGHKTVNNLYSYRILLLQSSSFIYQSHTFSSLTKYTHISRFVTGHVCLQLVVEWDAVDTRALSSRITVLVEVSDKEKSIS